MNQFLLVPEAQMAQLEAEMRALRETSERVSKLYQSIVSGAGHASLPTAPQLVPTTPPVPPVPSPAVEVHAAGGGGEEEEEEEEEDDVGGPPGGDGRQFKYRITRGGGWPTYADVIDREVFLPEFHIEEAWDIIRPLLAVHPEDWRRSVRRSLQIDKSRRFVPVEGRVDWFRRAERAPSPQSDILEGETAPDAPTSETVSDD